MTTNADTAQPAPQTPTISETPQPPYWAVIFTLVRTAEDSLGYAAMATEMWQRVRQQSGFLGMDSVYAPDGKGIVVAYFDSEAAIQSWRADVRHREAQQLGRERWYRTYQIRTAKVERSTRHP